MPSHLIEEYQRRKGVDSIQKSYILLESGNIIVAYEVVVKRVASSMVCKLEVFAGISGRGTVKHQVWKDLHNVGGITVV